MAHTPDPAAGEGDDIPAPEGADVLGPEHRAILTMFLKEHPQFAGRQLDPEYQAAFRAWGGALWVDAQFAQQAAEQERQRLAAEPATALLILSIQDPIPVARRSVFRFAHGSVQFSPPFEHKILRAMEFHQSLCGRA
jgi:hypothetical protein